MEFAGQYVAFVGAIKIKFLIDRLVKTGRLHRNLEAKFECIFVIYVRNFARNAYVQEFFAPKNPNIFRRKRMN
jgi:hypothetical protein